MATYQGDTDAHCSIPLERRESLEVGEGQAKTPPRQRKEPKMRAGFATYRPPPALGSSPRLKLAEEKPPAEVGAVGGSRKCLWVK